MVTLLEAGEASWAIVTNGKVWRLYSSKAHSRATNYYEIDLEETLAMQDPQEAFRFFWLLFREQAFVPVEDIHKGETRTTTFLDRLIEESETYAKELGEKLKSRVFDDIFPHFAEGFIEHMGGAEHLLSLSEEEREQSLKAVFQGTLTFLYRLLFLLYSESRNLLPVSEVRGYWDLSLSRLKKEIADHAGTIIDDAPEKIKKAYRQDSSELYKQLSKLFGVIDQGDADVNVPLYNGGLFIINPAKDDESPETRNARFLRTNKIPDRYLALGLDMMARGEDNKTHALVAIDYKSLGVRHLGSIYEGLLEFKLRIATEKMAVVKGKKTEEIFPYKEAKKNELPIMTIGRGKNAEERVLKKGTVYLENDKRERKATGSYYTPDYIVKYIVENTVGPVLSEKLDALRPKLREAQLTLKKERDKYKALGGKGDSPENQTYLKHRQLVDDLFDVKVLDPAMGSGHFLVEAVDFISDKILGDKEGFLRAFPWNPITAELQNTRQTILNEMEKQGVSIDKNRLTDVNLLKRHILKRCIYGVDLNPMAVELAKVSLWLDCFTLGAPLSFLDHHLKCGNSLIGAKVEEVRAAVETGQLSLLGGTHFQGLLLATDLMRHIGELSDVTAEQVKNSRAEFKKAVDALAPFKRYMDVYTSQWFGNAVRTTGKGKGRTDVSPALEFLRSGDSEEWAKASNKFKLPTEWKGVAATALAAADEKRFFHWELEYPEIFYGHRPGTTQALERLDGAGFDAVIGNPPYGFHQIHFDEFKSYLKKHYVSSQGSFENYFLFIEASLRLIKKGGLHGYIVPVTWLTIPSALSLRKFVLDAYHIQEICWLPELVFDNAQVNTLVTTIRKQNISDVCVKIYSTLDFQQGQKEEFAIHQSRFIKSNYYIGIFERDSNVDLLNKITSNAIALDLLSRPCSGYNPYEVGKGERPEGGLQTKKTVETKPYHSDQNHGALWKPEIVGRDLGRYRVNISGQRWIKYGPWLAAPRDANNFVGKRILIQEITGGKDRRIVAAYYDGELYHSRDVIPVKFEDSRLSPLYALGIINSQLITWYHHKRSPKAQKGLFPKVLVSDIAKLPIRSIDLSIVEDKLHYDKIVDLVNQMLTLNKLLTETINDKEKNALQLEIDAVDRLLDQLVYELYGLTNEEIAVVEGKP